jgi:hypothetical protein
MHEGLIARPQATFSGDLGRRDNPVAEPQMTGKMTDQWSGGCNADRLANNRIQAYGMLVNQ